MNPEHKESAEELKEIYDFVTNKAKGQNLLTGDLPFEVAIKEKEIFFMCTVIQEYAQLAVKEAREQDIEDMKEIDSTGFIDNYNIGVNACISIVKSKLEGGG
jgi:hypothetical protein